MEGSTKEEYWRREDIEAQKRALVAKLNELERAKANEQPMTTQNKVLQVAEQEGLLVDQANLVTELVNRLADRLRPVCSLGPCNPNSVQEAPDLCQHAESLRAVQWKLAEIAERLRYLDRVLEI